MEDLYSDLENYQYDNIVSELKTENQELKCKLEEYASTLGSLQKSILQDFDKLSAEYKKLEVNYSSLLKTARAEIERKSQMITNLNIEKDKLVIDAMQKRGRIQNRKNNLRIKQQMGKQLPKEDLPKNEKYAPDTIDIVSGTLHQQKKEKHDKTIFSLCSSLKDSPSIKEKEQKDGDATSTNYTAVSLDPNVKDNYNVKENELKYKKFEEYKDREKNKNKINNSKVTSVNQKTISLGSTLNDKHDFEESELKSMKFDAFTGREKNKNEIEKDTNIYSNIFHNDDVTNFDLATFSRGTNLKDKPDVKENESKFNKIDACRDRENNKNELKKSKVPSDQNEIPRNHRILPKKPLWDDKIFRDNRDKYEPSLRSRRPRPNKYKRNRRSREFDGQRFQREIVNPIKHKLNNVLEEPVCKRLKSESINKPLDKHLFAHDRDDDSRAHSLSRPLELSYLSIQSPDYACSGNHPPVQQIKEIRSTSDTKLDDPRLKSKKYVVNTHSNKVVLSTVVGRDVDVKAIDKIKWNKHKDKNVYEMPALFKEKPPISDVLVKEICMDIDNRVSNLLLESGEIYMEDQIVSENVGKGTVNTIHNSNNKNVHNDVRPQDQIQDQTCTTLFCKNYRIPKIKKSETLKELEQDISNSTRNKIKRDSTKQAHKKRNIKDKRESEKKLKPDSDNCNSSKKSSDNMDVCKNNRIINFKHGEYSSEKPIISSRYTVEGDLELSDETCDYDVPKQTKYDEGNKAKPGEGNKNIVIDNIKKDLNIGEPEKSECTLFKERAERPCENKHFNISHGGNEVLSKDSISNTNKEQKSKEIKNKFCYLFSDTSSQITLDDLGTAPSTTKENVNEYAAIFENTQDTLDLNIEEMEKIQTGAMKLKRDENESIIKDVNKNITYEYTENPSKRENKNTNQNVEKSSSLEHVFENINGEPDHNTVVKTVIISTGIQNIKHRDHSPEISIISARDTVEGDLELSDETCDYDVPEQTKNVENKAKPGGNNNNIVIDNKKKDLNIGEPRKSECTLI